MKRMNAAYDRAPRTRLSQINCGSQETLRCVEICRAVRPEPEERIAATLRRAGCSVGVDWAMKWQHALTMGVFATMILAVMTRASLGRTGRLVVSRAIAGAYVLLTLGAFVRVSGGALWPERYALVVSIAGLAWVLSFLLYLTEYKDPRRSACGRETGASGQRPSGQPDYGPEWMHRSTVSLWPVGQLASWPAYGRSRSNPPAVSTSMTAQPATTPTVAGWGAVNRKSAAIGGA
jgi:NnrS protein